MSPRRGARKRKSVPRHGRGVEATSATAGAEEKRSNKRQTTPKPPTGPRLWLFRLLAATVIPAILLLLAELSLRLAGCGFNPEAIVKSQVDGKDVYCDNGEFMWRFFPRNIARQLEPFVFPAHKSTNTYRIFVLGASAARGEPDPAFSFSRVLRVMLQDQYPEIKFELISAAAVAINSHVVLEIAKDCAKCDPDLFIVYLGNNEVTGPYGAGTVYTRPSVNLSLVRLAIALKGTRLGQLLVGVVGSAGAGKDTPKVWRGLEMFLKNQVRAGAPNLEAVYGNYEKNLKDISRVARRSGARIIFCTVGSNLKDCPPFASLHRSDMTEAEHEEWGRIYGQGVRLEAIRDYAGAAERYLAAARIDELYADLQFRLGRCYWAQGEYEKARGRYVRARELDTLRFRADDRINEIIRRAGAGKADMGIYLADASRFLERNSLNNTPGEELFHEHVHLNFKGTYLLATAILEQVRKVVPPQPAGRRVLTEDECAVRLPYTGWDRHEAAEKILDGFIRKPPFTNQLYHADQVRRMEQAIDSLKIHIAPAALEEAAAAYRQVIESAPGDWVPHWKYGKLLAEGPRDYQAAAEQYRIVQKLIPHSHLGHTAMGDVSRGLGDIERAVAEYGKAIRLKPTCIEAHYYLGWAYLKQNKPKLAKEYYSKTLRLQPDHVPACDNLAKILYQQGKIDEAIKTYRRGLGFSPNSSVLHGNLGMLLSKKGRGEEAIDELRTALALDPNSDKIRRMLEVVSKSQN